MDRLLLRQTHTVRSTWRWTTRSIGATAIAICLLLSVVGIGIAAFIAVGWWILYPLDEVARRRPQAKVQFSIADFLCLFILIQIPFVAIPFMENDGDNVPKFVIAFLLAALGVTIWRTGVVALTRAGIEQFRPRFIVLGVILPFVYYGLIPFAYALSALAYWVFYSKDVIDPGWIALYVAGASILGSIFLVAGSYTRKLARQVRVLPVQVEVVEDPGEPSFWERLEERVRGE